VNSKSGLYFYLTGQMSGRFRQLAEAIWQSLNAEVESTISPFESATDHFQLSFKSR
jgi:hypothetical protein